MSHEPSPSRYETLPYRRCGRSGLKLPVLSLGLWHNFGGVDSPDTGRDMILRAFDLGITHFDLANNYGPPAGSAEETFGKVLRENLSAHRDELIVSTKAGYYMWPGPYGEWGSRKYLLSSLDQSLSRMGLEYVDIFYSHRFDPETPLEETMGALAHAAAFRQGPLRRHFVLQSRRHPRGRSPASGNGRAAADSPACYHMFDRWIETENLTGALEENGVGTIAFCPLARGLLTSRYLHDIPADSRVAKEHGFLKKTRSPRNASARSALSMPWLSPAASRWPRWPLPGCFAFPS